MQWSQGTTEGGSSGAGLFSYFDAGGYYELRGGLTGGEASCSIPAGEDYFSRLDVALPLLREYLAPDSANPDGYVAVVEFYNATLDHYFITAGANEINLLDTGVLKGWVRTGLRFLGYASPAQAPEPVNPVCRFYMRPEAGDSHFYSGAPDECAEVKRKFDASWIYESPNVFYMPMPDHAERRLPRRHAAGVALPERRADEPPVHDRGRGARRAARHAGVGGGGLRRRRRRPVLAQGLTPAGPRRRHLRRSNAGPACGFRRRSRRGPGRRPRAGTRRPRDHGVHAEGDAAEAVAHPVGRQRRQRFGAHPRAVLVRGRDLAADAGLDRLDDDVAAHDRSQVILVVRRQARDDEVRPEPVHRHRRVPPDAPAARSARRASPDRRRGAGNRRQTPCARR